MDVQEKKDTNEEKLWVDNMMLRISMFASAINEETHNEKICTDNPKQAAEIAFGGAALFLQVLFENTAKIDKVCAEGMFILMQSVIDEMEKALGMPKAIEP